jgi:hypothetical protein
MMGGCGWCGSNGNPAQPDAEKCSDYQFLFHIYCDSCRRPLSRKLLEGAAKESRLSRWPHYAVHDLNPIALSVLGVPRILAVDRPFG